MQSLCPFNTVMFEQAEYILVVARETSMRYSWLHLGKNGSEIQVMGVSESTSSGRWPSTETLACTPIKLPIDTPVSWKLFVSSPGSTGMKSNPSPGILKPNGSSSISKSKLRSRSARFCSRSCIGRSILGRFAFTNISESTLEAGLGWSNGVGLRLWTIVRLLLGGES